MDPACNSLDEMVVVDGSASSLGVFVAYTVYWGPRVSELPPHALDHLVQEAVGEARQRYTLEGLKDDSVVRAYRSFLWRVGVDPTKVRPSGEALARRALRGSFPRINPVVDAGNIASLKTLVPIGLYDLDHVEPPLALTVSRGGEEFRPIGGGVERLRKGLPVLVDGRGVVLHVYPHRDSVYGMVRPSTSRVLAIAAGVPGVERGLLARALAELEAALALLGWKSCGRVSFKP